MVWLLPLVVVPVVLLRLQGRRTLVALLPLEGLLPVVHLHQPFGAIYFALLAKNLAARTWPLYEENR